MVAGKNGPNWEARASGDWGSNSWTWFRGQELRDNDGTKQTSTSLFHSALNLRELPFFPFQPMIALKQCKWLAHLQASREMPIIKIDAVRKFSMFKFLKRSIPFFCLEELTNAYVMAATVKIPFLETNRSTPNNVDNPLIIVRLPSLLVKSFMSNKMPN